MNGITYYTVSYHMQPIAHFSDYSAAVRYAAEERKRRVASLDELDPPMLQGERRGETTSIQYGVAVREVSIVFRDKVDDHEEIRFG
tara:strand:+ start:206 stop:463 length:258 start_codon:yes stop_codon:yes gene_type:complete